MTLAEACAHVAMKGLAMTADLGAVVDSTSTALKALNGPALTVRADDPRLRTFRAAPSQATRPDIREDIFRAAPAQLAQFRATPAELALGMLRPNDPRRTAFRATATEMALSWRNLLNGRPIGGL